MILVVSPGSTDNCTFNLVNKVIQQSHNAIQCGPLWWKKTLQTSWSSDDTDSNLDVAGDDDDADDDD